MVGTPTSTGGIVSRTVTVRTAVTVFVQASTAVHVRVMIVGQLPLVTLTKVGVTGPQLSVAVTAGTAATSAKHCTDAFPGNPTSTGGIVSLTVIVWIALAVLVQVSVAVHVRLMIVGQLPLVVAVSVGTITPSQLSVAVTAAGAGTSARHW